MNIKTKCIISYISILVPIIAIIGIFSMKTDSPITNFFIILSLVLILERICLRMEKLLFSYYYKKYLSVLNKELNPKKFLKLTDMEYKASKNKKYKNYMKINYVKGYLTLDDFHKAYNYLMLIDLSDKKYGFPNDMKLLYYYNLSLVLYHLNKKEEALDVYTKNILPHRDTLSSGRKNREMRKSVKFLEALLFDENNTKKMIQSLNESLENVKIKKNIIERKYLLAVYKEKNGDLGEAGKLYKEVIKKGNKLNIVEKAKVSLENIENKSSSANNLENEKQNTLTKAENSNTAENSAINN